MVVIPLIALILLNLYQNVSSIIEENVQGYETYEGTVKYLKFNTNSDSATKKCIIEFSFISGDFTEKVMNNSTGYSNYTINLIGRQKIYEFAISSSSAMIIFEISQGLLSSRGFFAYSYYLVPNNKYELRTYSLYVYPDYLNSEKSAVVYKPSSNLHQQINFYSYNCEINVTFKDKEYSLTKTQDGKEFYYFLVNSPNSYFGQLNQTENLKGQEFEVSLKNPEQYNKSNCLISIANNKDYLYYIHGVPFRMYLNYTHYICLPTLRQSNVRNFILQFKVTNNVILFLKYYKISINKPLNIFLRIREDAGYNFTTIYMNSTGAFIETTVSEDNEIPRFLPKNELHTFLATEKAKQNYIVQIEPGEESETQISFPFKKINVYAKIYPKGIIEQNANWAGMYLLPTANTSDNLNFNKEKQKLIVNSTSLTKCMTKGCDLIISVEIPSLIPDYSAYIPKIEYDIFFRSKIDKSPLKIYVEKFVKEYLDFSSTNTISYSYTFSTGNFYTKWLELQVQSNLPLRVLIKKGQDVPSEMNNDWNFDCPKGSSINKFDERDNCLFCSISDFTILIIAKKDDSVPRESNFTFVILEKQLNDIVKVTPGNSYLCRIENSNGGNCYFDIKVRTFMEFVDDVIVGIYYYYLSGYNKLQLMVNQVDDSDKINYTILVREFKEALYDVNKISTHFFVNEFPPYQKENYQGVNNLTIESNFFEYHYLVTVQSNKNTTLMLSHLLTDPQSEENGKQSEENGKNRAGNNTDPGNSGENTVVDIGGRISPDINATFEPEVPEDAPAKKNFSMILIILISLIIVLLIALITVIIILFKRFKKKKRGKYSKAAEEKDNTITLDNAETIRIKKNQQK